MVPSGKWQVGWKSVSGLHHYYLAHLTDLELFQTLEWAALPSVHRGCVLGVTTDVSHLIPPLVPPFPAQSSTRIPSSEPGLQQ